MARHNGLSFFRRRKKISAGLVKEIFGWLLLIMMAVFLGCASVFAFGMSANVVGVSMEPVLYNEQKIFINRLAYTLFNPKPGDVIIFLPNGNENTHYYVKRVVAVPGDTVLIKNGTLFVNGEKSEIYTEKILDPGIAVNELILANGEFFCLGDNPNNSEDSRSGNIGPVKERDIVGRVWFRFKSESGKFGFVR